MKTDKKQEFALYLSDKPVKRDQDREGATITVRIVRVLDDDKICNPESGSGFDNLTFTARIGAKYGIYGSGIEYRDLYCADRSYVKAMEKMYKRLDRIIDKRVVRPVTFGQMVAMTAQSLGIKRMAECKEAGGWSYEESRHQFHDLKYTADLIDQAAQKELDELCGKNTEINEVA